MVSGSAEHEALLKELKNIDDELTDDLIKSLVTNYYNEKSEFQGQFKIKDISKIQKQVLSKIEGSLDIEHTWSGINIDQSDIDQRKFILEHANGTWRVKRVGAHKFPRFK